MRRYARRMRQRWCYAAAAHARRARLIMPRHGSASEAAPLLPIAAAARLRCRVYAANMILLLLLFA